MWLVTASALLAVAAASVERPYPLLPGDPAPPLAVQRWVKGDSVAEFRPGTAYVIDVWATWCAPCKAAMPKLSALQRRVGDRAVFIALDSWDYAERVPAFVEQMGDRLDYRVAIDRQPQRPAKLDNVPMWVKENGAMARTWMRASGTADDGIPVMFLVDGRGRLAWIGKDPDSLAQVLPAVLDGAWDLDGYAARYRADATILKRGRELERRCFEARQRRDWAAALADAHALLALDPRYASRAGLVFHLQYQRLGDRAGAIAFADRQLRTNPSVDAFVDMARTVLAADGAEPHQLTAAHTYARHAVKLDGEQNAHALETLARVAARQGRREEAIAAQEKAVARTQDPEDRAKAAAVLKEYQRESR